MKKNAKKILLLFLCTALLIGCVPVASVALTTDTGLEYTASDTAVTITAYSGEDTTVEVPATLNGLPVTTIAAGAFSYKTQLEKVTLPETVTDIQMMAFFGLENLTDVNLESLSLLRHIGAYAFVGTKLSGALTLPESVEEIGAAAFGMTKLTSLHLGKNVRPVSAETANPWETAIKNIGMEEIAGINIASMISPYSSTAEEKNIAIACPNLKSVTVDAQNPYYRSYGGVLFSKDMRKLYCYPAGKTSSLYIMPSSVEHFYNAFGGLHLPKAHIKYYGDLDIMDNNLLPNGWLNFGEIGNLKTVTISSAVQTISTAAFYNTGLTSVYLPKNITKIGPKAFWHCASLTTVGFDRDSVYQELPEECFKDCGALKNITFGKIDYLAALAFGNCASIESVDLTNVRSLDSTAFDGCTALQNVTYMDSDSAEKATVSASAFNDTDSLKTVMLGSSVESVEDLAFANCEELQTVYISDEVEKISASAFQNSDNLTIVCPNTTCYAYSYAVQNNIPVTTLVVSPIPNQTYTGEAITPTLTVKAGGKLLTENKDYTVYWKNNVNAGTADAVIMGNGAYGMLAAVCKFAIMPCDLSKVEISAVPTQVETGEPLEPEFSVVYGDRILQKDTDYIVTYSDNTAAGTATVEIVGIGNYKGSRLTTFEIASAPAAETPTYEAGDVDGDGTIRLTDYALIYAHMTGTAVLTDRASLAAADINGDGAVDAFDLAELNLYLAGQAR